jgi:peptidoglycan glycosyltransferase
MRIRGPDLRTWVDYQERLQRQAWRKSRVKRLALLTLCTGCLFSILIFALFGRFWIPGHPDQVLRSPSDSREQPEGSEERFSRQDLLMGLRDLDLNATSLTNDFVYENSGTRVTVKSSFDSALQDYVSNLLERSKTLQAAVVALDPNDGRILAMASYEKEGNKNNLCLQASFPAASIFKIISAAAAFESAGFTPNQPVFFQGRRHTLYKRQLSQKRGKYTLQTSFRKAFASSINPVFGKLGIYYLGQEVLSEYADKFLFNREIPFDLPVVMSTIDVPDDEYGLAEIASGFNKKTLISPLHGALMVSAVANRGIVMRPWLVERVVSESGEILYETKPTMLTSPITRGTAQDLKLLMRDTVLYGTCRKSFRPLRRKKAFREVELGAKTGNVNDKLDRFKYDWLTAYALPADGGKALCIAVLGVHGKKLGVRANELGRYIINYYLSP